MAEFEEHSHIYEIKECGNTKGKGMFACMDMEEGDVLLEEEPIVSSQYLWNQSRKYRACDQCLKSLENAEEMARRLSGHQELVLPHPELDATDSSAHVYCPHCMVQYCCAACRDYAWAHHHRVLCLGPHRLDPAHPINVLQEIWKNMHYPPETASIMILVRMVAMVKQTDNPDALKAKFVRFCQTTRNDEENLAHKLLGAQFEEQLNVLRAAFAEAIFEEKVQEWFSPDGFRSLFALLGRNGQGIGTSSLSVWTQATEDLELPEKEKEELDNFIDKLYEDIDEESGIFVNCEGTGLYWTQSNCNHSCEPNVQTQYTENSHKLSLVVSRPIARGEEIVISYLDDCMLQRSRHSRQKALRENYLFECLCTKCLSQVDDPDLSSDDDMEQECC